MGRNVAFLFACLVLVLVFAEAAMSQKWIEELGKAMGKEIGKKVAAEMAEQELRKLMQEDDNFMGLVEALRAGHEICDDLDKEYGSGTCANVKRRLLR